MFCSYLQKYYNAKSDPQKITVIRASDTHLDVCLKNASNIGLRWKEYKIVLNYLTLRSILYETIALLVPFKTNDTYPRI